jgi:hypothetical protein
MLASQVNHVCAYAETQQRPTMSGYLPFDISDKSSSKSIIAEIKNLQQTQHIMTDELKNLMCVCNKIGESVKEVCDKLSQYDIDSDETSITGESDDEINGGAGEDDEINEPVDDV